MRERAGAFERADGGTVFLDEVGELPPLAQASLLGVLERKRFRRVGGDREITVDVRVVSATNRDLRSEVNRGSFRADLYFRLAGARVVVPPLRERPEDIAVLVRHFALEMTGSDALPIAPDVLAALAEQHWAGNVRELRSAVERVVAFGASELGAMLDDGARRGVSDSVDLPSRAPRRPRRTTRRSSAIATRRPRRSPRSSGATSRASSSAATATPPRRRDARRWIGPYLLALLRRYGLR